MNELTFVHVYIYDIYGSTPALSKYRIWCTTLFFILYYWAGNVNMLQLLMVAGYTIYEHVNTQQLISDALASGISM